jgi:hypothetical protein
MADDAFYIDDLDEPLADRIAILIGVHTQCGYWEPPAKGKARERYIANSLKYAVEELTRYLDGPGFDLPLKQIISDFDDGLEAVLADYATIEDEADREAAMDDLETAATAMFRAMLPRLRQQPRLSRTVKH